MAAHGKSGKILLLCLAALLVLAEAGRRRANGKQAKDLFGVKVNGHNRLDAAATDEEDDGGRRNATDSKNRKGKVFSLFTVVNFQNTGCQSTSTLTTGQSQFRNGTCFSSSDCSNNGGSAQGSCAAGFGVCCVFTVTGTSGTVTQNCTYVQNPSFPSAETAATTQTITVQKCRGDVCFLRLDFEQFSIQGPADTLETQGGQCPDTFDVTVTTAQVIPQICGVNTGQHIYVDIGAASTNTATLTWTLGTSTTGGTWDVKVTQVECSNPNSPRDTCLQYQTELSGRITTFNYAGNPQAHLASQQYSICIRAAAGYCCIQYDICPDQQAAAAGAVAPGFSLDATQAQNNDCTSAMNSLDYVAIPLSSQACTTDTNSANLVSSYCGNMLNAQAVAVNTAVCDCTAPFTVDIYTNPFADTGTASISVNAIQSFGVCLEYMQIPCQ